MIRDDQWKTDMINAVQTMEIRNNINFMEAGRLLGSMSKVIPADIPPYDPFTSYLFEKANEEVDQFLKGR